MLAGHSTQPKMKIRVLLFALLGSTLAIPAIRAADQPEAPQKARARGHEKHTELGNHMEKMGRAFRTLGRQIHDASKNEESLKLVEIIKTNAQAGLELKPEKTADIPADQQAKFVSDYQQGIKHLIGDLEKLETALKAGNNDEAAELVKTVKKDMDSGHKEFRKKHDMM